MKTIRLVKQTILMGNKDGIMGNCWQASIASLLSLELDEVPHFVELESNYLLATMEWLKSRDYTLIEFRDNRYLAEQKEYWGFHIISGISPRKSTVYHSIIGLRGEPYFDPHPDNTMIVGNKEDWIHTLIYRNYE